MRRGSLIAIPAYVDGGKQDYKVKEVIIMPKEKSLEEILKELPEELQTKVRHVRYMTPGEIEEQPEDVKHAEGFRGRYNSKTDEVTVHPDMRFYPLGIKFGLMHEAAHSKAFEVFGEDLADRQAKVLMNRHRRLQSDLLRHISTRAEYLPEEFVAETYLLYLERPDELREVAPDVYNYIERKMG